MEARLREIIENDIRQAFLEADKIGPRVLSFTNHDFRNMEPEILKISKIINKVRKEYPEVEIINSNPVVAARESLGLKSGSPNLKLDILDNSSEVLKIKVTSNEYIFGIQPYLAFKSKSGNYGWENFDKGENKYEWTFTFDFNHIPKNLLEKIGIAANSIDGSTHIINLDLKDFKIKETKYLYES